MQKHSTLLNAQSVYNATIHERSTLSTGKSTIITWKLQGNVSNQNNQQLCSYRIAQEIIASNKSYRSRFGSTRELTRRHAQEQNQ